VPLGLAVVPVSIAGGGGHCRVLGEGAGLLEALAEGLAEDAAAVPALYDRRVLLAAIPLRVLGPAPRRQPTRHGPEPGLGGGGGWKGGKGIKGLVSVRFCGPAETSMDRSARPSARTYSSALMHVAPWAVWKHHIGREEMY